LPEIFGRTGATGCATTTGAGVTITTGFDEQATLSAMDSAADVDLTAQILMVL
jgi:hypothetical protein